MTDTAHSRPHNLRLVLILPIVLAIVAGAYALTRLVDQPTRQSPVTQSGVASAVRARPIYRDPRSPDVARRVDNLLVSFTARVAVRNVHSAYSVLVRMPTSCHGGVVGRMLEQAVASDQRVQVLMQFGAPPFGGFARCPGSYQGSVLYKALPATAPPDQAISPGNFTPTAHPLVVGRFTFDIKATAATYAPLPKDDATCKGFGKCNGPETTSGLVR